MKKPACELLVLWRRGYLYLWLYNPCEPCPFFQFRNPRRVGRSLWTGDQPLARPLPIHRTTQNKRKQTSMPRVGLELTIPVFERAKTVHASVIGRPGTHLVWWKDTFLRVVKINGDLSHSCLVSNISDIPEALEHYLTNGRDVRKGCVCNWFYTLCW
jgi:hypothetical protein